MDYYSDSEPLPHVETEVERTYKQRKYVYNVDGFLFTFYQKGYAFQPDLSADLPDFFKNGKPKPKGRGPEAIGFWKAQCSFRGLSDKGDIKDLQMTLNKHRWINMMVVQLRAIEQDMREDYRVQHAKEIAKALAARKAEHNAEMKKSITELLRVCPLSEPKQVVVYKERTQPWLLLGAEKIGLTCYTIVNPGPEHWGADYVYYFVVMSYDAKLCEEKVKELQEEGRKKRKQ